MDKTALQLKLAEAEAEIARLRARECSQVRGDNEAAELIRQACHTEQETFIVVYLDARQRPIHVSTVGLGTISQVSVHPREVFRDAVRLAAHSIIVGHNHPSGHPDPSDADIGMTQQLVEAGRVLGIPVLDHIVVTSTKHVSLAGLGLMG